MASHGTKRSRKGCALATMARMGVGGRRWVEKNLRPAVVAQTRVGFLVPLPPLPCPPPLPPGQGGYKW